MHDQATECVTVAVYVPGARFAGMAIEISGFHDAELGPVLVPVTTGTTPVRFENGPPIGTTGPDGLTTPVS